MNILFDKLDFNEEWAFDTLKKIIKPEYKVCIIPFAFHEDWMKNTDEWLKFYNKIDGSEYVKIATPLYSYGIKDDKISLIDYFSDSYEGAKEKIKSSDILFFTGGYPDKTMIRLAEFGLIDTIEKHKGIKMGWSAGSMMQCHDYFISPDEDYPEFIYKTGLKGIENFAVEVHYKNTDNQNKSIKRYIRERDKLVYITEAHSAIIVDDGNVKLLGNARIYQV